MQCKTKKARRRDPFYTAFIIMIILNMFFYQLYPISIAIAEDSQILDETQKQEEKTDAKAETISLEEKTSGENDDNNVPEEKNTTSKSVGDSSLAEEKNSSEPTEQSDNKTSDPKEEQSDTATENITNETPSESSLDLQQTEAASINTDNATDETLAETNPAIYSQNETPSQEITDSSEPFWKSCPLEEDQTQLLEEDFYKDCAEKTDCDEIKICIKETISNSNTAVIKNEVSTSSDTGENTIDTVQTYQSESLASNSPTVEQQSQENKTSMTEDAAPTEENIETENTSQEENLIDTGDAVSQTAIINDVNTNIVTENGERNVQEITDYTGDINLLEIFLAILKNSNVSDDSRIAALEIFNKNYAQIENIAKSDANTGNNTISGNGSIETGNAEAIADIVNIANQNIVGSDWLLAVVNVFGTWIGNLIVPGKDLLNLPAGTKYSNLEVINKNTADISNTANSASDSGNNKAIISLEENNDTSNVEIETGSSYASNAVTTITNTNIVKNNWFMLIINNMGSWIGSVFDYDNVSGKLSGLYSFDFASLLEENDNKTSGSLKVHNENYASIQNTATSKASTGSNELEGNGKLSTGNAYSRSSILNFVNSNFIGDNWLFGMVNIFGKWDGNVIFAYPDLEISIDDGKNEIYPSEKLDYKITVKNIGKAAAAKTLVSFNIPENLSSLSGSSSWEIAGLDPGSSQEFTVSTRVTATSPSESKNILANASVSTETTEKEKTNNSAQDETTLLSYGNKNDSDDYETELSISRTVSTTDPISSGEIIKHSIVVKNKSDVYLSNVILKDDVIDQEGNRLGTYQWPLGDMDKNDAFLIEYEIVANAPSSATALTYKASAKGEDPDENKVKSRKVSLSLMFIGGTAYAASNDFEKISNEENSSADASVLGEMTKNKAGLPLWIWILSAIVYFLTLSWSLFTTKRKILHQKIIQ